MVEMFDRANKILSMSSNKAEIEGWKDYWE